MSDVFILGAGFSKAISDAMPVLADLSRKVQEGVPAAKPVAEMFPGDIEMCLTYLSQNHPWLSEADNLRNRALFVDLSRAVAAVVNESVRETTNQDWPPWLSPLIDYWASHRCAVLTLNYDTLAERACERKASGQYWYHLPVHLTPAAQRTAGIAGRDTKEFPEFVLFKLHGSTHWFYSGAIEFSGETIYEVPVFSWQPYFDHREREHEQYVSDKVPFIVPPLTEKLPFFQHETIRAMWRLAGQAVREATRIFCLGYSLPETDITMRFFLQSNAPQTRVKFYLATKPSASDPTPKDRFARLLGQQYEIEGAFVREEDPIPKLVAELTSDRLDKLPTDSHRSGK